MEHYRNNPVSLASTRMRRSVAADYAGTAPLGFTDSGVSARRGVREPMRAAGPSRRGNDGSQRGGSAPAGAKRTGGSRRGGRASGSGSFMKYATDNAFVRQREGYTIWSRCNSGRGRKDKLEARRGMQDSVGIFQAAEWRTKADSIRWFCFRIAEMGHLVADGDLD